MRLLNGRELSDFIKERQAQQVRALRQANGVHPKLAIICTNSDPVISRYMKLKQAYGSDILIDVDVHLLDQSQAKQRIEELNADPSVHGIIVQLPLQDPTQTTEILDSVVSTKDVDGLAASTSFDPATPLAINWLLAGYNIDLATKKILVVGNGRLVGKPLVEMWRASGYNVTVVDKTVVSLIDATRQAEVLVCATGVPNLIKADMVQGDAVIVDAGVATDQNGLVGDVDPSVRELPNITITPEKGGVGPLTVCALFDNVIRAARRSIES